MSVYVYKHSLSCRLKICVLLQLIKKHERCYKHTHFIEEEIEVQSALNLFKVSTTGRGAAEVRMEAASL